MPATLKRFIESIAGQKAPGPSATFTVSDIYYALELMAEKPIGRNMLAKKLNIGDGAIRTIINRLKDAGLIEISKEGCNLTSKGCRVWKEFEEYFPKRIEISNSELAKAEYNFAFLVKNSGRKVKSGIEQRDAAIMAGAKRAVIIVAKGGRLTIDSVSENVEKDFPRTAKQILVSMQPRENDVVVIAGADTLQAAKRSAFAASWALLENGKSK